MTGRPAQVLYACRGGAIMLPAADLVLVDREDGGNLIVNPTRPVWERGELTAGELADWGQLVAASGAAMLAALPQLSGGCINYWEAGNWALNDAAPPAGPKPAPGFRSVHLHLLGRSRAARSSDWAWGEAPRFPPFVDRHAWAAPNRRLTAGECVGIVDRAHALLTRKYGMSAPVPRVCVACGYPAIEDHDCGEGRL